MLPRDGSILIWNVYTGELLNSFTPLTTAIPSNTQVFIKCVSKYIVVGHQQLLIYNSTMLQHNEKLWKGIVSMALIRPPSSLLRPIEQLVFADSTPFLRIVDIASGETISNLIAPESDGIIFGMVCLLGIAIECLYPVHHFIDQYGKTFDWRCS